MRVIWSACVVILLSGCSRGEKSTSQSSSTGSSANTNDSNGSETQIESTVSVEEEDQTASNDSTSSSDSAVIAETDDSQDTENGDSESVNIDDNTHGSASDSESETAIPYGETELLYDFPEMEDTVGFLSFEVDDTYVYFASISALARAEKIGGGDVTVLDGLPAGSRHQNVAVDSNAVYWLTGEAVRRMDKVSLEVTPLPFKEPEEEIDIDVLWVDEERIYLAGPGCVKMIAMATDGSNRIAAERTDTVDATTITVLTTDANHVYCATGRQDSKVVRWPKSGGEIAEVTVLPERLDEEIAWLEPQVTGMSVVDESVYIVSGFPDSAIIQYFGFAPAAGGAYSRILDLTGTKSTRKTFYDEKRKTLYFYASGNPGYRGVYKYDVTAKSMSHVPLEEIVDAPIATDEEYIYFHTRSQIRRIKKF